MGHNTKMKPVCHTCGDTFSMKRKAAGYKTCLWCGEEEALQERRMWCIAPMHKSNYMLITNPADLKTINPKYNNSSVTEYVEALEQLGESEW